MNVWALCPYRLYSIFTVSQSGPVKPCFVAPSPLLVFCGRSCSSHTPCLRDTDTNQVQISDQTSSPLSDTKCPTDSTIPTVSSPDCRLHDTDMSPTPLTCCNPLPLSTRRPSSKAMSVLLLHDTIAVSHGSDTTLPTVTETRLANASMMLTLSVPVTSTDFVQGEDYTTTFTQLRTISAAPRKALYVFRHFNAVPLPLTHCCIEAFPERHRSSS